MRFNALACDYDGTIAHDGRVSARVIHALDRLRASGRRLILVTGRELGDLSRVFARMDLFDCIVAENGGVLFEPATGRLADLGEPPPEAFVDDLRRRGVEPLSVGRVIVATCEPHRATVLAALRSLGLARDLIPNKDAVMLLPPGIDKAVGLAAAVARLAIPLSAVVGMGDAENDLAFLRVCGYAVAVGNALSTVRDEADFVTRGEDGDGVVEFVERMLI